MNKKIQLMQALKTWQKTYMDQIDSGKLAVTHLSDEEIYPLAENSGIEQAVPEALEHLSLCPICMEKWAAWREAISAVENEEPGADMIMSYGTLELKAAATDKPFEAMTSLSSCGRFTLGLLPQVGDPKKGLVTLDVVTKDEPALENRYVMVRDRGGRVFLRGKIHQGRLARRYDKLEDIDLSKWTVIEKME